jgi:hypothetical protein
MRPLLPILVYSFLPLWIAGCDRGKPWESKEPPDPNHVQATDEIRKQYGINPILPDFEFSRRIRWKSYTGEIEALMDWWNPKVRISKTVVYDVNFEKMLREVNTYHSGHQFPAEDGDGPDFESLSVTIDYITKRIDLALITDDMSKYSFPLPDQTKWDPSSKGNEYLERARLILQMWGIKRL